jgi:dTDP-4-dehydrorhamnose reductase
MRVAVIGKSGQLARCLAETAPERAALVCMGRGDIDLADWSPAFDRLGQHRPHLVVNAAAYTAVDNAEADRDGAFALNARGPRLLAEWCAGEGASLIHVSTDYVFDGESPRPYVETDATAPLNVYGESKLTGERMIADVLPRHLIIRASWLYSPHGANFVKTMLKLAAVRDSLRIVSDQTGRPTSAIDLAAAIWDIAAIAVPAPQTSPIWGVYHYAGTGETSWADFAATIFASRGAGLQRAPGIEHIATADYPTPARRPHYSVLDTSKIESVFGVRPPPWQDSLANVLSRLKEEIRQ